MKLRDGYYILRGHEPVPCDDLETWGKFMEGPRHVGSTHIGDAWVSTVFFGGDHNYNDTGPPLLFETMVFGGPLDQELERYATWDEAARGHEAMCKRVREARQ